jgi:hypothetical protein
MIIITNFVERLQTPAGALSDEAQNGGEVVGEDNGCEPCTVAEAGNLKDFFILLVEVVLADVVVVSRILPGTAFIDFE